MKVLETSHDWSARIDPEAHVAPAYAGQSVADLTNLLDRLAAHGAINLEFRAIDDGYFLIAPGQDGVILDKEGRPLEKSAPFRNTRVPIPDLPSLRRQAVSLDFDVFVAMDQAWGNYYHWLCLSLPKMLMAQHVGGPAFRIALPAYRHDKSKVWSAGISERTWDQSLYLSGLADNLARLPQGVYRAPKIHTIFIDHQEIALLPCVERYDQLFEPIRRKLRDLPASPRRILIQRRDTQRLQGGESQLVTTCARDRGFVPVDLQDFDFLGQAELFHNAEAVIAPHGAALSNLLFGKSSLNVLELNRFLPKEQHLRPWFYLLARAREQSYSFLNLSRGDLTSDRFGRAVDALCETSRQSANTAIWWNIVN